MAQQAEEDYGCNPMEQIKKVHDEIHDGSEPEEPHYTTTKKLMRPGPDEELEG